MAQVYGYVIFRNKIDWHSDDFELRNPVNQKQISGNVLPESIVERVTPVSKWL